MLGTTLTQEEREVKHATTAHIRGTLVWTTSAVAGRSQPQGIRADLQSRKRYKPLANTQDGRKTRKELLLYRQARKKERKGREEKKAPRRSAQGGAGVAGGQKTSLHVKAGRFSWTTNGDKRKWTR